MTIHHAVLRRAEKMGVSISEDKETDTFDAHWVEKNVHAFGVGGFGKKAMDQMDAIKAIYEKLGAEFRVKNSVTDPWQIKVYNHDLTLTLDREGGLPIDMLAILEAHGDKPWFTTTVPIDGAQAYKEGWTAGDNPFRLEDGEPSDEEEESGMAEEWDEAFDAAADAAQEEADAEPSGSVVKPVYRMRYAEAGHPNHCGDWLADTLNNLILGKTHTDLDNFEALCNANGVSLAKYRREGNGWQGRLRMTGRNLLATAIYKAGGVLKLTPTLSALAGGETELHADVEWMTARAPKGKAPPVDANNVVPITSIPDAPVVVDLKDDPDLSAPNVVVPDTSEQLARHRKSKKNR